MMMHGQPPFPGRDLEQWNLEQEAAWQHKLRQAQYPEEYCNGFACPKCGVSQLYDTGKQYSMAPVVLQVKCMSPTCTFKGTRRERVWRVED